MLLRRLGRLMFHLARTSRGGMTTDRVRQTQAAIAPGSGKWQWRNETHIYHTYIYIYILPITAIIDTLTGHLTKY